MYYIDKDGSIVPTDLINLPEDVPASRMFACVLGASRHPDAVPVTAIKITTPLQYDAREVMDNGWSIDGLTPCGQAVIIEIEN